MNRGGIPALTVFAVLSCCAVATLAGIVDVDPFIGCAGKGHAYPGPAMPFGLVQPGPDTGNGDWAHCSGYVRTDKKIYGFSQTHLNGTGCPDFGDVRLLPFATGVDDAADEKSLYALKDLFGIKDEATERAVVGFYSVAMTNLGMSVSITAGRRVAFYRFHALHGGRVRLLVDPQWGQLWLGRRVEDHILKYEDCVDADRCGIFGGFVHRGWLDREVHFKLRFNRPYDGLRKFPSFGGEKATRYLLDFGSCSDIEATIALSTTDDAGAEGNYAAEAPMGFDAAQRICVETWERYLGRVEADGCSQEARTTFFTALYHAFLQPNVISDADGRYRGPDKQIHVSSVGRDHYSGFSLWDTFRAAHPLYTIVIPELVGDFVTSMLDDYRYHGFLPVSEFGGAESYCMIGNHAVPVVVDAVLKGIKGIDKGCAYEAVTNSLTVTHYTRDRGLKAKEDWNLLERFGYYPFDLIRGEGVSRTLECAYDDACAARLARMVGDERGAVRFARRAENWTNVFDRTIGLCRGKDTLGRWREPFDPYRFGGGGEWDEYDCTEGNAWQYTWHVLHDPLGLISRSGGGDEVVRRLDSIFRKDVEKDGWAIENMTGRIGQYVHGNEPSHHIPYLYSLAGRSDRTAEVVREICDRFYLPTAEGLCGNDDCGQMSAWYVFAAFGFYPFDPCGGDYVIGAPQLPKTSVRLPDGRVFSVSARNLSRKSKYVKAVSLNGQTTAGCILRHSDIVNGGELKFEMTGRPNQR